LVGVGTFDVKLIYFPGFMGDARDLQALRLETWGFGPIEVLVETSVPHLRRRGSRREVLADWANELRHERANLVLAYSMGARIAAELLQHVPELADRALLLSPHPGLVTAAERQARCLQDRAWAMRFRSADSSRAWRRLARAWNSQTVFQSQPQQPQQSRFGREEQRFRYARELELLGLATQADQRSWYREARGIKVLIGERDAKFRELWRELPHEVVPEAGHRLLVDAPQSVRNFCVELLEG
jgi:pimeloyl-ACP methyl ester carboxylesterase